MSSIDLNNAGVLRNFLFSQMKEGKGEFSEKKNVAVFKDHAGNEFVLPDEFKQYVKKKDKKEEKKEETIIT